MIGTSHLQRPATGVVIGNVHSETPKLPLSQWRSFARRIPAAGKDLATIQRLLGHERVETTAIYTQPTARDLEQAVRRLEAEPG